MPSRKPPVQGLGGTSKRDLPVDMTSENVAIFDLTEQEMLCEIDEGLADIKDGRIVQGNAVLAKMRKRIDKQS